MCRITALATRVGLWRAVAVGVGGKAVELQAHGSPAVLEALAGGVAVVSTDVGGVPYLVEHRRSALLVPPQNPQAMADAMLLLLEEPDLKERLRQAGLQLADQYTWAQVRPRLLQVYRSVIEKANKAGGPSATGGSKA